MTGAASPSVRAPRRCEGCGHVLAGACTRRFCNGKCRALAHRVRKQAKAKVILYKLKNAIAELEDLIGRE